VRIGVLDLLSAGGSRHWSHRAYAYLVIKQYASIMPQAVSVWCRNFGHEVFYATYYGQRDPKQLLPNDLDLVFISAWTQASALAYALAKLYRQEKTLTVIGGPHAKQFPDDCLRFFDVVVRDCDKSLIADILSAVPLGEIVTSGRILQDIPSVQERMPEIRTSTFWRGKPYPLTSISLLTSMGCPYGCDFCVDWNNPYVLLPLERLEADLRFILENFPGVLVVFHDPNFAVKFAQVLAVLERVSHDGRKRYIMESSLSILRRSRLERLRDVGFVFIAPGVESWTAYSKKAGTGSVLSGREKLNRVVEHFELMREYIPAIQANLIFGLDVDEGDEPVELTKEFMTRVPFVWPQIFVLTPYGGTPLYHQHLAEGRLLTSMPFAFYWGPYLVTTFKNYSPMTYYEKCIEMFSHMTSGNMLAKRLQATSGIIRLAHLARTLGMRQMVGRFRRFVELMKTDRQFRAFHEGESQTLPEYYHRQYEVLLGPYATLLSHEDRQPVHHSMQRASPHATHRRDNE
jgi:radical SAM superfamily enzyme YgiQ (UPF0313 family)